MHEGGAMTNAHFFLMWFDSIRVFIFHDIKIEKLLNNSVQAAIWIPFTVLKQNIVY